MPVIGILGIFAYSQFSSPAKSGAARAEAPIASHAQAASDDVFKGPFVLPKAGVTSFTSREKEALADGPNFAGHYLVMEIGCGTSCFSAYMIDLRDGAVKDLPYQEGESDTAPGGIDHYDLRYDYKRTSRIVNVSWQTRNSEWDILSCISQTLRWNDAKFEVVKSETTPGDCPSEGA